MYSTNAPDPAFFAPLPPIAYVGFGLLFLIPGIGQILAIILAFKAKNINLRSYSRAFLIRLAIAIIVVAIIATIQYSRGKLPKILRNIPKAWKLIFPK